MNNRILFIQEALDSIVSQITDEIAIVMINNAKTDNTAVLTLLQ